jgi:hypothetical protein
MDGVATQPVVGANDMAKFLSIVDKNNNVQVLQEGSNPHKVSLPVQIAMQHYQQPKEETVKTPSLMRNYLEKVAEEEAEEAAIREQRIRMYSQKVAERVLAKENLKTNNPCWKGYHPVGTKKKNGKTVPNCVPSK